MVEKIIDYEVVTLAGTDDFVLDRFKQEVNAKITSGWQPVGGIQSQIVVVQPGGILSKLSGKTPVITYTQALVRYEILTNYKSVDHPLQSSLLDIEIKLGDMIGYLQSIDYVIDKD
jgi:hypothetical protein